MINGQRGQQLEQELSNWAATGHGSMDLWIYRSDMIKHDRQQRSFFSHTISCPFFFLLCCDNWGCDSWGVTALYSSWFIFLYSHLFIPRGLYLFIPIALFPSLYFSS
jgi:hypothetical protein